MKGLFRHEPLREYPNCSASHLHAGEAYDARFLARPGRAGNAGGNFGSRAAT